MLTWDSELASEETQTTVNWWMKPIARKMCETIPGYHGKLVGVNIHIGPRF